MNKDYPDIFNLKKDGATCKICSIHIKAGYTQPNFLGNMKQHCHGKNQKNLSATTKVKSTGMKQLSTFFKRPEKPKSNIIAKPMAGCIPKSI